MDKVQEKVVGQDLRDQGIEEKGNILIQPNIL